MQNLKSWLAAALLVLPACVGAAPPNAGDDAPAPDAAPDDPDPSAGVRVSGMTMDYFTGLPAGGASLATDGVTPPASSTSAADGNYALEDVLPGSVFYVDATKTNYRPTRSAMLTTLDVDVTENLWLVSNADANRQYATLGLTPTADTAVTFVELLRNNGTPLLDVPLADITLVDSLGAPVGLGPYFFGESGDVDANVLVSTAYGTPLRARVAFLDIPPGSYTMKVNYLAGGGGGGGEPEIRTYEVAVVAVANGAALGETGGQDDDGGGGGGGETPTFAANIWPMLQKGADGGLGCANCHTALGTNPALQFDLPAADTLAAILARPGVVNLATPLESLLLTKPLYELPPALQNHPNATFANQLDPNYILFLRWIEGGALP
jgi:hypothetical protein